MDIQIINTILIDALNQIQIKGKYFTGGVSRNGSLGNHVAIIAHQQVEEYSQLTLCNANHYSMCKLVIPNTIVNEPGEIVVEIDKLISHLKGFGKGALVDIHADDTLVIGGIIGTSQMPLLLNHPLPAGIATATTLVEPVTLPAKFGSTEIKTKLTITSFNLLPAVKGCDIIDVGKYRMDYDETIQGLTLSSVKSATESFSSSITVTEQEGESATIEFSGPFLSFFNGSDNIRIYMRDDSPVMFCSDNQVLVKAPFIEG